MLSQPSRPSGVDSYVTPVSPPPCHINSGSLPLRSFGRKYCTYICSTMYWPFGSSLVGGPPGCRTISRTGFPLISTTRPPTWNEPMPRSTMSCSAADADARLAADTAIAIRIRCILYLLSTWQFVPAKAGTQIFIHLAPRFPLARERTEYAVRDSDKSELPLEAQAQLRPFRFLLASMWATARAHRSRLRHQPATIANDQTRKWMADLDMKTEAAVLSELISVDARRDRERQRQPEQTPAPHHQQHSLPFDHQRHDKIVCLETLAPQTRTAVLLFLLLALEPLSREVALPKLPHVIQAQGDLERHVIARGRRGDNGGGKPREEAFAPLVARNARRRHLALEF